MSYARFVLALALGWTKYCTTDFILLNLLDHHVAIHLAAVPLSFVVASASHMENEVKEWRINKVRQSDLWVCVLNFLEYYKHAVKY